MEAGSSSSVMPVPGKYICPQFLYAISKFYIYQLRSFGKRIVSNTRYIVSNRYFQDLAI